MYRTNHWLIWPAENMVETSDLKIFHEFLWVIGGEELPLDSSNEMNPLESRRFPRLAPFGITIALRSHKLGMIEGVIYPLLITLAREKFNSLSHSVRIERLMLRICGFCLSVIETTFPGKAASCPAEQHRRCHSNKRPIGLRRPEKSRLAKPLREAPYP